jgi:hypothetical protein
MTKNNDDFEDKGKKKQYMWLGFGNYSGGGLQGPVNPGNVRASPSIFDKLLEFFGVKDKDKKEDLERIR